MFSPRERGTTGVEGTLFSVVIFWSSRLWITSEDNVSSREPE